MQIKSLPARYPTLGRVRLGEKVTTKSGKEAPRKGENLRFTSNDETALFALASQLGGEVVAWENGEQAFQITTESPSVPVFLPPDPIDTSYERWGSGGCQRRCDGERCMVPVIDPDGGHLEERDCRCLAEDLVPGDRADMKNGACQVTVRLRLVLPDVPGIGVWLCTSHSLYAAMELPGQVALLETMRERGQLVPAEFAIEPRHEKKPYERYARDYIVPVLRIRASLRQLGAADSGVVTEIAPLNAPAPALPAPRAEAGEAVAGEASVATTADAPAAADPPAPPPSRQPSRPGGGNQPRHRTVRAAWKPTGLGEEELHAIVAYATDKATLEELATVDEGNDVLDAIKDLRADKLTLQYRDDGTPYYVAAGQGVLA